MEDLHHYFTGAKPKAGVDHLSRRAFVKKDGASWNGTTEYRPAMTDVSETEAKLRKQLRTSNCHFAIQHFGAIVPYAANDWTNTNFDRLDKELVLPLMKSSPPHHLALPSVMAAERDQTDQSQRSSARRLAAASSMRMAIGSRRLY